MYQLFLSQDSREAWRLFRESCPATPITSLDTWGQYAASLYTVASQPPLPDPLEPCPQTSTFFTVSMVREAIDRLCTGKAQDHDGLVAEHIHARDTVA